MPSPESLLTKGLLAGFAGETNSATAHRGGFALQTSHFQEGDAVYHDEWAAHRTGGGQELVTVDQRVYTRVYAGGTTSTEAMTQLGITKQDVLTFLVACLRSQGNNTRLHEDCGPHTEGDWAYTYQVLEKNTAIPMTTGKETITYKGQVVFIHVFVLCPVE